MKKALVLGIVAIFAFSFAINANAQDKKAVKKTTPTTQITSQEEPTNEAKKVDRSAAPSTKTATKDATVVKAPKEKVLDVKTTQDNKNGTFQSSKKENTTKTNTLKKENKDLTGKGLKNIESKAAQKNDATVKKATPTAEKDNTKKDVNLNKSVPPTKDPKTVNTKATGKDKNIK